MKSTCPGSGRFSTSTLSIDADNSAASGVDMQSSASPHFCMTALHLHDFSSPISMLVCAKVGIISTGRVLKFNARNLPEDNITVVYKYQSPRMIKSKCISSRSIILNSPFCESGTCRH